MPVTEPGITSGESTPLFPHTALQILAEDASVRNPFQPPPVYEQEYTLADSLVLPVLQCIRMQFLLGFTGMG